MNRRFTSISTLLTFTLPAFEAKFRVGIPPRCSAACMPSEVSREWSAESLSTPVHAKLLTQEGIEVWPLELLHSGLQNGTLWP